MKAQRQEKEFPLGDIMVEVAFELYFEGWREVHSLEVVKAKSATWGSFSAPLFLSLLHRIDHQVLSLITHHCLYSSS